MTGTFGIYWHQGLFLQPQHFQWLEANQDRKRNPIFESMTPYLWGVGALEIAQDALGARSFEIKSAQILFRDHTFLDYPGNSFIAPRSFDKVWVDGEKPLNVFLGIRKPSTISTNVTVIDTLDDAATASTRLVSLSNPEEAPDLYSNGPKAAIPVVSLLPRIFFGPEQEAYDDYDYFQIARLVRDGEKIKQDIDFVPPTYLIQGSTFLDETFRDIRDDIAGRLRQLLEYKAPRDHQLKELSSETLTLLQAIQILSRATPAISHLAATETVHPWLAYGLLASLIGELSLFSNHVDFMGRRQGGGESLPAYDHENLGPTFAIAKQLINSILNEISFGPEALLPLVPEEDFLVTTIPDAYLSGRKRFYLVTNSTMVSEQLSADFTLSARLASFSALPSKIDHALPAIELIEVLTPPQGLSRKPGSRFYRIEQMSAEWEAVQSEGRIALFWKHVPEDFQAYIAVLRG